MIWQSNTFKLELLTVYKVLNCKIPSTSKTIYDFSWNTDLSHEQVFMHQLFN